MNCQFRFIGFLLLFCFAISTMFAQVAVTTYHNDNGRTGQNLYEPFLTPSTVDSSNFGLLHILPVQGLVDGQPLYAPNVSINGSPHNVVYVATEHDFVYAFDADN